MAAPLVSFSFLAVYIFLPCSVNELLCTQQLAEQILILYRYKDANPRQRQKTCFRYIMQLQMEVDHNM